MFIMLKLYAIHPTLFQMNASNPLDRIEKTLTECNSHHKFAFGLDYNYTMLNEFPPFNSIFVWQMAYETLSLFL